MPSRSPISVLLVLMAAALIFGSPRSFGDDETAEQRFEKLLAPALQDPEKADWNKLREAFAGTPRHEPYNTAATTELRRIAGSIGKVDPSESEAALVKLVERERFMRLDSVFILMRFYEDTKQPDQAAKYRKLVEAITKAVHYPEGASNMEQAPAVLYVEEEYIFLGNRESLGQKHLMHDGHHFDVLTVAKRGDQPERSYFFNIDLVWKGHPLHRIEK